MARTSQRNSEPTDETKVLTVAPVEASADTMARQGGTPTNRKWLTAEAIAVATGIGYTLAYLYQIGLVLYYGIPAETIRVSPEWVIFIAVALVPSALAFVSQATLSDAIEKSDHRAALRWLLTLLALVLAIVSAVIGSGGWASFTLLVSVSMLSLAFSDWLGATIEAVKRNDKKPSPYMAALALVIFVILLMGWVTWMGTRAADTRSTYLVDKTHSRVLVYSTDNIYVFEDYLPSKARLTTHLTYMSASSIPDGGLALEYTRTGRLTSAVLPDFPQKKSK